MRKLISLMMVLVLGVVVMGTSAYAVCPGPNAPSATIRHGDPTPSGDDSGWNDPHKSPELSNEYPVVFFTKYILFELLIQIIDYSEPGFDIDGRTDDTADRSTVSRN